MTRLISWADARQWPYILLVLLLIGTAEPLVDLLMWVLM